MKKIIVTESQINYIKNFIVESDKSDAKKRFLSDIISKFSGMLDSVKPGDILMIATGEYDFNADDINWKLLDYYSFKIIEINGDELYLDFIISDNDNSGMGGTYYTLNKHRALKFNNGEPYLQLSYTIDDEIKNIRINNYLMSQILPNGKADDDNDNVFKHGSKRLDKKSSEKEKQREKEKRDIELANKIKSNEDEFKRNIREKWLEGKDKILKSMVFEPSFLSMDNIFFFPKGYIAMDNILKKYGLNVHDTKEKNGDELTNGEIKFRLNVNLTNNGNVIMPKTKHGGTYNGQLNIDDRKVFYEKQNVTFKILGDAEIIRGSTYQVLPTINGTALGYNGDAIVKIVIM